MARKPKIVASRTVTVKSPAGGLTLEAGAEAMRKIDFSGLARDAAKIMRKRRAAGVPPVRPEFRVEVDRVRDVEGWTDATLLRLALDFIEANSPAAFVAFLRDVGGEG